MKTENGMIQISPETLSNLIAETVARVIQAQAQPAPVAVAEPEPAPVAVEPVAVEPVAVEPVAVEPLVVSYGSTVIAHVPGPEPVAETVAEPEPVAVAEPEPEKKTRKAREPRAPRGAARAKKAPAPAVLFSKILGGLKMFSKKSTLPILQYGLIQGPQITYTTLETSIRITAPRPLITGPAVALRPANGPADFATLYDNPATAIDPATVSNYNLPGSGILAAVLAADDFPCIPCGDGFDGRGVLTGPADDLAWVSLAISDDQNRFVLNGLHIDNAGTITATDGRRLHRCAGLVSWNSPNEIQAQGVIIPEQAVKLINRFYGSGLFEIQPVIGLYSGKNEKVSTQARFYFTALDNTGARWALEIFTRLIDGKFPDPAQIIPNDLDHANFGVDLATVRTATDCIIKAVPDFDKANSVKLIASDRKMQYSNPEHGAVEFPVEFTHAQPDDFAIAFNPFYLRDLARAGWDPNTVIRGHSAINPSVAQDQTRIGVLMPMRIN
jgi:DNA polymerase III sliding clamp (beta) subunit (PCNA family)